MLLLELLAPFFVICLTHANSPEILSFTTSSTGRFQPRQNEQLRLICRTRYAESVEFRKDGKLLARTIDARMSRSGNSLFISNLDHKKDDGSYQCFAKNNKGSILSKILSIKVSVLGEFQGSFTVNNNKKLHVTVGRALLISCPLYSYTYPRNIIWGNAPATGQPRVFSASKRRYQLSNGNLFFSVLQQGDIDEINQLGGLSCFLYHNGPYKQSARYKLEFAGRLLSDYKAELKEGLPAKTVVTSGNEVSFYCAAAGTPIPSITWYKPDGKIISASDTSYVISPTSNKLTIKTAFKRYAGKYKCEAVNRAGKQSSEGTLVIEDGPSWRTKLKDVIVADSRNATFTCIATGSGIISYRFFKNGNIINKTNATYTVNGGKLIIKKLIKSDFGMIQCFAKNTHGEISSSSFLNIKGSTIPPTKRPYEGNKIHFGYYILIGGGAMTVFAISSFVIYLHTR